MNQKLSWSIFIGGLATFLTSIGDLLVVHHTWEDLLTPIEVGHLLLIGGSFCITLMGALNVQLTRGGLHFDRVTDSKLNEIKNTIGE